MEQEKREQLYRLAEEILGTYSEASNELYELEIEAEAIGNRAREAQGAYDDMATAAGEMVQILKEEEGEPDLPPHPEDVMIRSTLLHDMLQILSMLRMGAQNVMRAPELGNAEHAERMLRKYNDMSAEIGSALGEGKKRNE